MADKWRIITLRQSKALAKAPYWGTHVRFQDLLNILAVITKTNFEQNVGCYINNMKCLGQK